MHREFVCFNSKDQREFKYEMRAEVCVKNLHTDLLFIMLLCHVQAGSLILFQYMNIMIKPRYCVIIKHFINIQQHVIVMSCWNHY